MVTWRYRKSESLIGLVSGDGQEFQKMKMGKIRPANGEILPDQNVKIKQGYVEESNVNAMGWSHRWAISVAMS